MGGVSGPGVTTLGEIAATGRNRIVTIVAPNVLVVARATLTGEFSVGSDPKVAGAIVKAIGRHNASIPRGVNQALIGVHTTLAGLVVRPTGDKGAGHGLNVFPLACFPGVVFGFLAGIRVGPFGGAVVGGIEEDVPGAEGGALAAEVDITGLKGGGGAGSDKGIA